MEVEETVQVRMRMGSLEEKEEQAVTRTIVTTMEVGT